METLPPIEDPSEFESFCLDLFREIWADPGAQKNGRSGQPQAGVDVFGRENGVHVGVQCKQKDGLQRRWVTVGELEEEVDKAKAFVPPLGRFLLATTGPRDGRIQKRARELSESSSFSVGVWSWDDLRHEVARRRDLFDRIFPVYWPILAGHRPQRTAPSRLRHAADKLFGREAELARLDAAWADPKINVLTLVAWGGVGKTALVGSWVGKLAEGDFGGADYFDWSFYSQGTSDQRNASADGFVDAALRFFGDAATADSARSAWDKGATLAKAVGARKALLVLDGLEPLQYPPGPLAGELKDPAMAALLKGLAGHNAGLCLVTTRERVADLAAFETTTAPSRALEHLSIAAGVELLKARGVWGSQANLEALIGEVRGHALTLNLVGRYLADAHGGDVRKRDLVRFEEADAEVQGGHACRVMKAYEGWFSSRGEEGRRPLAVLRLLGLFDRPASTELLRVLRKAPAIPGLTEALFQARKGWRSWFEEQQPVTDAEWSVAVSRIVKCGLVVRGGGADGDTGALDAHPLVREHFGRKVREENEKAFKAAHGRLFDHLQLATHVYPESLAELQPLYHAIYHGCQAGRYSEACRNVLRKRIQRGMTSFSKFQLGAIGEDLTAIACFYAPPWERPSALLKPADQAWISNEAAFCLRAQLRIHEAAYQERASLESYKRQKAWGNASRVAGNLSEINLLLGEIGEAIKTAKDALMLAVRGGDLSRRMIAHSILGSVMHQVGSREQALENFEMAEDLQGKRQPLHLVLYSVQGFHYCELLIESAERLAGGGGVEPSEALENCLRVRHRATDTLSLALRDEFSLLARALDRLSLGRAQLYESLIGGRVDDQAAELIEQSLGGLRVAGTFHMLPLGLLTRAWLRSTQGNDSGARADLDEAQEIAERGPMPLYLADIALYRARLFRDRASLAEAWRLVRKHGYWRRKEELEDLDAVADSWPAVEGTT